MAKSLYFIILLFSFIILHSTLLAPWRGVGGEAKDDKPKEVYKKKTILSEVKSYNKAQNYAKVDNVLQNAFKKYPEAQKDAELMNYETMAQFGLQKAENRKIYLNNKPDTAKYFSYILNTYTYGLRTDSLDQLPNRKGKVKPKYTNQLRDELSSLRNNLKSGGKWFYKRKDYANAIQYFDMYINTIGHSLTSHVEKRTIPSIDADSVELAKLAVISAYGAKQYPLVMRHFDMAIQDSINRALMYEICAKSHQELGDSTHYITTLRKGLELYPLNDFFYATLVSHYNSINEYDSSLVVLNRVIEVDARNRKFWYLKGKVHQCLNQTDSAIVAYQQAIQIQADDAESFSALGNVYLDKAHQFYNSAGLKLGDKNYLSNRRKLNNMYSDAMKAYESARKFDENNQDLWLSGLRETYFKLNKGKELKALEKIK